MPHQSMIMSNGEEPRILTELNSRGQRVVITRWSNGKTSYCVNGKFVLIEQKNRDGTMTHKWAAGEEDGESLRGIW